MKRIVPTGSGQRFQAQVRHYHRTSTSRGTSWDEWVDGGNGTGQNRRFPTLLKVLGVLLALGILGGIIVGLVDIL